MVAGTQLGAGARLALLVGAAMALSGCMGPTYGTGSSAGAQLIDDLDNFASLTPTDSSQIAYAPRPDLVRPASVGALPPPQATRNTTNDPNWPESPEQRRARLQAAGDRATGDGDAPIDARVMTARGEGISDEMRAAASGSGRYTFVDDKDDRVMAPAELRSTQEQVKKLIAERNGSPTQRRFLSEPPVAYRQPAASAPVGDPGEDEEVKERRVSGGGGSSIWEKMRGVLPGGD